MITKSKGAKDNCPSCGKELVCNEKDYKGNISLQWQNPEDGTAHFNFDFKTKKSSCKATSGESTVTAAPDKLDISGIDIEEKQALEIISGAEDITKRLLLVFSGVKRECEKVGITHPASIGMIFNQVCDQRRYSGQ